MAKRGGRKAKDTSCENISSCVNKLNVMRNENAPEYVRLVSFQRGSLNHCSICAISFISASFSAATSLLFAPADEERTRRPRLTFGVLTMVEMLLFHAGTLLCCWLQKLSSEHLFFYAHNFWKIGRNRLC